MSLIFEKVRNILHYNYNFHYVQIQPMASFEHNLGVDSREMLELINEFEQTFNIEIDFDDIPRIITIQDAVNYIQKQIRAN